MRTKRDCCCAGLLLRRIGTALTGNGRKVGEVGMKRPWPESDDFFWIGVWLAVFFTFCLSALYALG